MARACNHACAWPLLVALCSGCGENDAAETSASTTGASSSGAAGDAGGSAGGEAGGGGGGGATSTGGSAGAGRCDETLALIDSYHTAHPGQDGDVNAKTPDEVAADAQAQQLMALCGADQRPLIPLLAWEYGGSDHAWIDPQASAVFYCVFIPVDPPTDHWQYDPEADHVTADVTIGCPEQNPCKAEQGADQVLSCLGDETNIEIMVDLASLDDGAAAGLSLAEASTDLYLLMPDDTKVHLYTGL